MDYAGILLSVRSRYLSTVEAVTYFLAVPFGLVFLFFSASYELKEIRAISFGAAAACIMTIIIFYPIRRNKIDSVLGGNSVFQEKEHLKKMNEMLHSIPRFESFLISIRWLAGITAALFFSHLAEPAGGVRILSFAVLYFLMFPVNWISAYLAAENSVNPLFMHPAFSEISSVSEYKIMTFRSKIFCCFSAVVLQLAVPFSFLMYMFWRDLIKFQHLEMTLGLFLFFAILLSYFVSRMLLENFSFSVDMIREISEEFSSGNFQLKANPLISRELSQPLNSLREKMAAISERIKSESEELLKCANRMNLLAEDKKQEISRQSSSIGEISAAMDELNSVTLFIYDRTNEAEHQMKTT
ncbi:MAG TPA: methyl-accepting chemotaxis protein, partial [Leptospiraceae bacterium]|nr:methyl-accepting chemotaxis protein [Leptospiraceae bacterium]